MESVDRSMTPNPTKGFKAVAKLTHILLSALLVLMASTCYATSNDSNPADNVVSDESISIESGAISHAVFAENKNNSSRYQPIAAFERIKAPDGFYHVAQAAFVGSIVADLSTTWALPNGMKEADPLLGKNKIQQAAVSGALTALALWQAHALHSKGRTRAAKYILLAGIVGHAFAGYHNSR